MINIHDCLRLNDSYESRGGDVKPCSINHAMSTLTLSSTDQFFVILRCISSFQ